MAESESVGGIPPMTMPDSYRPMPQIARFPRLQALVFAVMHRLVGRDFEVRTGREMADAMRHARRWDVVEIVEVVEMSAPSDTRE